MKKLITILGILATTIMVGCKSLPTTESMSNLGYAAGYTTAYVLNNQVTVDDATRGVIIEIVTILDTYLPATNETCSTKWVPMVKNLTDKYVAEGKLTQLQADRVVKDFTAIASLLDQYIDKKGVRQYQELVDAFVHSFSDSFLTNFKPANTVSASAKKCACDKEMYDFLTANIK